MILFSLGLRKFNVGLIVMVFGNIVSWIHMPWPLAHQEPTLEISDLS